MAEKIDTVTLDYSLEASGYLLVVGHAHRVGAFADAYNLLGDGNLVFLNDLVVLDDVDGGLRGDEGYAVQLVIFEIAVSYLDDAFAAESFALKVASYGYLV